MLEGDAQDVLKTLDEPYDFIFMDAAKGQYIHFLPDVLRLLVPGRTFGLGQCDAGREHHRIPVLCGTPCNRAIDARMREDSYELKHNELLETSIVPLGDGVALSAKAEKRKEKYFRKIYRKGSQDMSASKAEKTSGTADSGGAVWKC